MAKLPGQIDKYEIVRRIGHGGMGTVYLARDRDLARPVAIKVLRDPLLDEERLERFLREARAAANLRHENIITIYDVGQHDHQPFMAMEYVDGTSLAEVIAGRQPLTLDDKLSYIEQICAGLHYAHRAGIVHRDVKPANLMVDRHGVIRILDFGIARIEGSGMTQDGAMMGTLSYMSPEQMLGRPVDYRSDIFSVGAVWYELLAYQQAFKGTLDDGLLQRLPHEDPPPLMELCPGLPRELEQVVMRSLAKRPEHRFADLEEARAAVRDIRRGVDPLLQLEPLADRTLVRWPGRKATPTPGSSQERRELLERRARQIAIHRDAARAAYVADDLDGAIAACEDALTLDPDDAESLKLLGELQQAKQQRIQESRERYDRERTIRQRIADAELKLSNGDIAGAGGLLQQALALDPRNPSALALMPQVKDAAAAAGVVLPALLPSEPEEESGVEAAEVSASSRGRRIAVVASAVAMAGAAIVAAALWLIPDGPDGGGSSSGGPKPAPSASVVAPPATAAVVPEATVPTTTAAPVPAVTTVNNVDASLQKQLDRITATYRNGDLQTALQQVSLVLETTSDDRVSRLASAIASAAYESMSGAASAATNQKAPELSRDMFATAERSRILADRARKRNDYVETGRQALAAASGYKRAEREALAAAALLTSPPRATPVAATNPVTTGQPNSPPPAPKDPEVAPAATAPPNTPAVPAIAAPSAVDRERPGILQTLNRYQSAYRERNVDSLVAVYPSLPREQRQGLGRAFKDCRDYDVTFGNMQLALNADDPTYATVTVRTTYTCQPKTAQAAQPQSLQELFALRKLGDAWLIESAGTMDTARRR